MKLLMLLSIAVCCSLSQAEVNFEKLAQVIHYPSGVSIDNSGTAQFCHEHEAETIKKGGVWIKRKNHTNGDLELEAKDGKVIRILSNDGKNLTIAKIGGSGVESITNCLKSNDANSKNQIKTASHSCFTYNAQTCSELKKIAGTTFAEAAGEPKACTDQFKKPASTAIFKAAFEAEKQNINAAKHRLTSGVSDKSATQAFSEQHYNDCAAYLSNSTEYCAEGLLAESSSPSDVPVKFQIFDKSTN